MSARVSAVVLAAGESSRMGRSKPLLPIDGGETFLGHLLSEIRASRVERTVVVLGFQPEVVLQAMPEILPLVAVNPSYSQGQLSSLHIGLKQVQAESDAILMCLADHPFITHQVMNALIQAYDRTHRPIVIPTYGGGRGHPTLFGKAVFQELLDAPLDQGARVVVRAHAKDVLELPTEEIGVLADIDTPQQYEQWLFNWRQRHPGNATG